MNAAVLQEELAWLEKVIEARLTIYFKNKSEYKSVFEIVPPLHSETKTPYVQFIHENNMEMAERLAIALVLAPHVQPWILDFFFMKNTVNDRGYTIFGGLKGMNHGGFLPTGETLMFLLAADEIEERFDYMKFFAEGHFFYDNHFLKLEPPINDEPVLSGALKLSKELIEMFTTGQITKQNFSLDFPAKLITTQMEWPDLVLPDRTIDQLGEIKSWVTYSHTLMKDWGMEKKLKPGFKTLFYGPPGTGKTLSACLLGKLCSMDVYRIDLSMMISKYIGETEKNLSKIFDLAENKNWILFFDEAEALFGKRTGVSDAHDRFANQEVSYLLQRIEDFNGVVILASNLKSNIDDAFTRRFQSVIYFPMPGPEHRLQLWNNAFPEIAEREGKINLNQVAIKYELTGGTIMNIMRYASLMALSRNEKVIMHNDILNGIKREYLKEGKVIS